MAEYIEREAVLNILASKNAPWNGYQKVSELPAADVQPVVRCNECNLYAGVYEVHGVAPCIYWMHMTMWDDYCSHGVRKDGEDNCGADMRETNDEKA